MKPDALPNGESNQGSLSPVRCFFYSLIFIYIGKRVKIESGPQDVMGSRAARSRLRHPLPQPPSRVVMETRRSTKRRNNRGSIATFLIYIFENETRRSTKRRNNRGSCSILVFLFVVLFIYIYIYIYM